MTLSQINNQIRIGWRLFFVVLLIALCCSCSSRKTSAEKVKEVQKIENNETISDKSKIETNVKVIDCTDIQEQIIEPIDNTKEIVIYGKVYKNVRFKTLKKKNNITTDAREFVSNNVVKKANTKAYVKTKGKVKQTERKTSYWWLLLLIPIYFVYKKYFSKFGLHN